MAYLAGWDVQGAQLALELFGIIDIRQQVGDGNQLAVVEQPADEAGVVITTLLAVGEYVDAGTLLGGCRQSHGIISGLVKLFGRHAAFEMIVEGA